MTSATRGAQAVRTPATERHVFMAVVKRILRDQRRSPLTWGIPLGIMSGFELAIYPSVEKSLSKAMNSYPEALKQAFHIETMDTAAKYLNAEMFSLIIPLAVAFFAIRAVTRPIVGAEERHWLDTVLAAPVKRRTLMAGAFVASAISTLLILLVMSVITWLGGAIFGAMVGPGPLAAGSAEVFALVIFFAGFAQLLCGPLANWAAVTGIAAGLLLSMYVIDVAARITDALRAVGPLTAFHYYGTALTEGLQPGRSAALMGIGIAMALLGTLLFDRRDVSG